MLGIVKPKQLESKKQSNEKDNEISLYDRPRYGGRRDDWLLKR